MAVPKNRPAFALSREPYDDIHLVRILLLRQHMDIAIGEPSSLEVTHQYVSHSPGTYIVYGADFNDLLENVMSELLIIWRWHGRGGRRAARGKPSRNQERRGSKQSSMVDIFHISPLSLNKRERLNIKSRELGLGGAGRGTATIRKLILTANRKNCPSQRTGLVKFQQRYPSPSQDFFLVAGS